MGDSEQERAVTVDRAIDALNRIHKADPAVMRNLILYRVNCNQALADDPHVQVAAQQGERHVHYSVGLLGIINGIFGPDIIAAHFDGDRDGAGNLTGFIRYEPPDEG